MRRSALLLLGLSLAAVALVPTSDVVSALAKRYNTIAGFRSEVAEGFATLQLAILATGSVLGLLLLFPSHLWPKIPSGGKRPSPWGQTERVFVGCAILGALVLRLIRCDQSLQDDEWFYYKDYIRHGPLVVLGRSTDLNNQILSNFIASIILSLFPFGEAVYRMPGIIAGAAAVLPTYALLRRYAGPRAAVLGALIYAVHPFSVGWSQEARASGYLFLLAPSAILLYHRLQEEDREGTWIAYIAVQTLIVWAHLLSAMFPTLMLLHGLWARRRDPPFRTRWLMSYAMIVLASLVLYSLHLGIWFRLLGIYSAAPAPLGDRFPNILSDWTVFNLPWMLRAVPFLALAWGVLLFWRERRHEPILLLALSAALMTGAVSAASFLLPSRYATFAFVLWIALLARGGAERGWRAVPAWASLALFVLDLAPSYVLGKFDSKWATQTVAEQARPGESIGYLLDTIPIEWYARRSGLTPVRVKPRMDHPPAWICMAQGRAQPWLSELLRERNYVRIAEKRSADGRVVEVWNARPPP